MKHFLRTYALGLLTATLIIGIYYFYFAEQEVLVKKIEMTETEMVSSLKDAGYYIYETEPEIAVPDEVLPNDNDSDTAEQPEQEPENDEQDDASDNSELPAQTTDDDDAIESENNDDSFVLTIEAGMTISQVADYLIVANIIDNRNEFASYLVEHNYGTNIQIGQFELNRDMSLAEIAKIIARQNE